MNEEEKAEYLKDVTDSWKRWWAKNRPKSLPGNSYKRRRSTFPKAGRTTRLVGDIDYFAGTLLEGLF